MENNKDRHGLITFQPFSISPQGELFMLQRSDGAIAVHEYKPTLVLVHNEHQADVVLKLLNDADKRQAREALELCYTWLT